MNAAECTCVEVVYHSGADAWLVGVEALKFLRPSFSILTDVFIECYVA